MSIAYKKNGTWVTASGSPPIRPFGMSGNAIAISGPVTSLTTYTATEDCYVFVSYNTDIDTGYHYVGIDSNVSMPVYSPLLQGKNAFCVPLAKGHTIYISGNASYATYYSVYSAI